MQGVFRWAWRRGPAHVDRLLIGGAGFFLAAYAANKWLTANPFLVFVAGVMGAFVAAYAWALIRAPLEQRDAVRTNWQESQTELSAISAERDRLLAQDKDNDLSAPLLHHRTIRLADLPMNDQGIVSGKRFEHCVIKGPGLMVALTGTNLTGLKFEGPVDSLVWVVPNALIIGAVGLEYCEFLDCRMERVAVASNAEQATYLKKMLSGQIRGYKVGEDGIKVIE
jgi:hypothetical protein